MILAAICLVSLIATHQQSDAYPNQQTESPPAQVESVRLELDGLDPKVVQTLLETQLKDLGQIVLDGKTLHVRADPLTVQTIRQTLAKCKLGQLDPASFLPTPPRTIAIQEDSAPRSLGEIFEEYCNLTGLVCLVDANTRQLLDAIQFNIIGVDELTPALATSLLQKVLFQEKFLLDVIPGEKGLTFRVLSQNQQVSPLLVDSKMVSAYASQDALYIQTVLSLQFTDIRSASNVLRQLIHNPQNQRIIPIGSSNEMLLQGPGPWVNQVSQILLLSDQARNEHFRRAREDNIQVTDVIRLNYADPKDILFHLEKFFPPTQGQLRITSSIDPRLNAIVLRCTKKDLAEIKDLIAQLDVK